MANVLLDYFFKFTENKGTPPPDYSFLHRVAIAVKPNSLIYDIDTTIDGATDEHLTADVSTSIESPSPKSEQIPYFVDVYDEDTLLEHTNNRGVLQAFKGGLSAVRLLVTDTLSNADKILDDSDFFTFGISNDFTEEESSGFAPSVFNGVVYSVASNKTNALKISEVNISERTAAIKKYRNASNKAAQSRSSDDIKTLHLAAEELAVLHRRCIFLDTAYNDEGAHYAFGRLLSSPFWRDQQYTLAPNSSWAAATKLGHANDLFDKKISFYLFDAKYGTRLAFFGAGGESITEPYIDRYIQLDMQGAGLNYISANFPRKTASARIKIEDKLQDVIDKYSQKPYEYLDTASENEIKLFDSTEMYYLAGLLNIRVAEPIWRIKVEVTQE